MTVATLLRRNGYRTAMVGKWHLGFEGGFGERDGRDWSQPLVGGPVDRGFDTFFGMPASLDIPPYYWIRDRHAVAIEVGIQNSGLGLVLIFTFLDGLGGAAMIAAWWGVWHLVAGMSLAWWWGRGAEPEPA